MSPKYFHTRLPKSVFCHLVLLDWPILMPKTSFFCRLIKTCEVFESEGELIPGEEHGGGERRRSERLAVSVIALEGAKS